MGSSESAVEELKSIARKASSVYVRKPGLRRCGASIVASILRPKLVYPLAFAKVPAAEVEAVESGYATCYGAPCRWRSGERVSVFPWDVLAGSTERRLGS